jgi:hypothetical protein
VQTGMMEVGAGGGRPEKRPRLCKSGLYRHDREGYQERSARFNAAATVSSRSTPRSTNAGASPR